MRSNKVRTTQEKNLKKRHKTTLEYSSRRRLSTFIQLLIWILKKIFKKKCSMDEAVEKFEQKYISNTFDFFLLCVRKLMG